MSVRSAGRGRAAARSIRLALRSLSIVATSRASLPRWVFRCRGSRRASSASIPTASRSIPLIPIPAQPITGRGQHARSTPSPKLMDGKLALVFFSLTLYALYDARTTQRHADEQRVGAQIGEARLLARVANAPMDRDRDGP